jgi:hypothetical protein
MKRILILCLIIGSFFSGFAQTPWGVKNYNFYPFNGIRVDKVIKLPDTSYALAEDGSIAFQNHAFWLKDTIWKLIIAPDDINVAWGTIIGDPNDQSDLMALINAKANKSTTLMINGVAHDLSTNRSWGPFLVPVDTQWLHDQVVNVTTYTNSLTFSDGLHQVGSNVVALHDEANWNAYKFQGRFVASTTPLNGQVYAWDSVLLQWKPTNVSGIVSTPTLDAVLAAGGSLAADRTANLGTSDLTFSNGELYLDKGTLSSGAGGNLILNNDRSIWWGAFGTGPFIGGTTATQDLTLFSNQIHMYGVTRNNDPLFKMMVFDTLTKRVHYTDVPSGGGGSTPGIDDVLAVGQSLGADRTIATGSHKLTISTSSAFVNPLYVSSVSDYAIRGVSTNAVAISAQSTSDVALSAYSGSVEALVGITQPSSTNTIAPVLRLQRTSTGTSANGIGASIDFNVTTNGGSDYTNKLVSKWINATHASRLSQFIITGNNAGSPIDLIKFDSRGYTQLTGITATEASALTASAGMIVFVTSTDATFTSVGFWGYDGSAWSKF